MYTVYYRVHMYTNFRSIHVYTICCGVYMYTLYICMKYAVYIHVYTEYNGVYTSVSDYGFSVTSHIMSSNERINYACKL